MWQPDDQREPLETLVKRAQTSEGKELSKHSKPVALVVRDWLTLYAEMYPAQEVTPEIVLGYRNGLEHLSPSVAHEAFKLATRDSPSGRRGFRPSVGEICECAEHVNAGKPKSLADPDCRACLGTGFETVPDPHAEGYLVAISCRECRKATHEAA